MESEYQGPRLLLAWHEARAMGLRRAWWRAGYELRKRLGRLAKAHGPDPEDAPAVLAELTDPPADEAALLAHFREHRVGRTCLDRAAREEFVAAVERIGGDRTAVAAAEEVIAHRFTLMGRRVEFGEKIDWHRDLAGEASWPREPWDRIDIRSPARLGDVKFVWELNRHQFWPTLGRAYWLTGVERYAAEWTRQFESWAEQNPPEIGVNWLSNLEHALRLVSWWQTARFMLNSPYFTAPLLRRLVGLSVAKARHIVADLDYSRINMANNHLIGDALGLAMLGLTVPELREAGRWRDMGLEILWGEALRQIHEDGSSFECAACYHRFVLQFYLLAIIHCALSGVAVPPEVRKRVERMAEFLAVAVRPDGSVPQFGDWDSGLAYRLSDAPVTDFRPVLSTAAVLFGRGDFKAAAGRLDQETIWLLGPQAVDAWDSLPEGDPAGSNRAFARGGYFFGGAGQRPRLMVKNGPFTSHTHADLLSVSLFAAGRPLLVDAGTYTYNGAWRWRTHFRGTAAHNTVTIDGQGQALAHRAFRWLFPPAGRNNFFASTGRLLFDGEHDGYRRAGVTHRRIILALDETSWLCLDVLTGRGSHDLAIRWRLAPDLAVDELSPGRPVVARAGETAVLTIAAAATAELGAAMARGDEDAPAGWYSPEYGVKEPACEIAYAARAEMPFCAATVLALGGDGPIPAGPTLAGNAVGVSLRRGKQAIEVSYNLLDSRRCRGGETVELGRICRAGGEPEILRAECICRY